MTTGRLDLDLSGKVVLISGTGGGQGRAAALLFAAHGATVVGCDVNDRANRETAEILAAAGHVMTASEAMDLSDPDQARRWIDGAAETHGRLDVLYNNGSAARFGPFGQIPIEDWHFTVRNEIDIVYFCCHFAWPHLIRAGGVIINTASVAGQIGSQSSQMVPHSAAKGAVIGMTKQLAVEGAPHGIRCVSISPGGVATPGTREMLENPTIRQQVIGKSLIPRIAEPEEVASLALFLASGATSYITGADFLVDGGMCAH